jgi:mono/diheme cytochrome c family protein
MAMKQSVTPLRWLATAALGAALAAVGMAAASAQDTPAGDANNGKRLYLADGCFECHGRAGQGGAMNYQAPALAQLELPVESFVAFLREAPNDMPAYSADVLSDKDAADIHAFLRSLPGRKPAKDFPLLNQ